MEAKEYTVKSWQAWPDRDSPEDEARDGFGNYLGTVTFEEFNSEPVDARFKEQPKPGDKKYGKIETYKTKQGKERTKFTRVDRPREDFQPKTTKKEWQPRDDEAIQAQFAIGQAAQWCITQNEYDMTKVEEVAKKFFSMIKTVKGSDKQTFSDGSPLPEMNEIPDEPINLDDLPY